MDWIVLIQDRDKWRVLMNAIMNLRAPWNVGKFLSGSITGDLSLLHIVNVCSNEAWRARLVVGVWRAMPGSRSNDLNPPIWGMDICSWNAIFCRASTDDFLQVFSLGFSYCFVAYPASVHFFPAFNLHTTSLRCRLFVDSYCQPLIQIPRQSCGVSVGIANNCYWLVATAQAWTRKALAAVRLLNLTWIMEVNLLKISVNGLHRQHTPR
jgi:hypothetical protein